MSRIVGDRRARAPARACPFAGVRVVAADDPEAVRAAWTGLSEDVALVILTADGAAQRSSSPSAGRAPVGGDAGVTLAAVRGCRAQHRLGRSSRRSAARRRSAQTQIIEHGPRRGGRADRAAACCRRAAGAAGGAGAAGRRSRRGPSDGAPGAAVGADRRSGGRVCRGAASWSGTPLRAPAASAWRRRHASDSRAPVRSSSSPQRGGGLGGPRGRPPDRLLAGRTGRPLPAGDGGRAGAAVAVSARGRDTRQRARGGGERRRRPGDA